MLAESQLKIAIVSSNLKPNKKQRPDTAKRAKVEPFMKKQEV
jgi:hypothetical protein